MTDEQLAKYLGIENEPRCAELIAALAPKRAVYERMASLEVEISLWQEGLGPKPKGVLIDMAKTPRKAKNLTKRLRKRAIGSGD